MLTSENLIEWELKKINSNEMELLLMNIELKGWDFDHPFIVGNNFWSNLLGKMLEFDPEKRWSFQQIKQYLSDRNYNPSDLKPPSRDIEPTEQ